MKRVPALDSYMALSSPYSGYDPRMEGLAKKHVEVYKRKKSRASSPVLVQRNVNTAISERMGQWEAEKGTFASDLQYAQARLEYLEDMVQLQRDTVERPLRRQNKELETKVQTFQNQLNVVGAKVDEQVKHLAAKDEIIAALKKEKESDAKDYQLEREKLQELHKEHIAAERRANEAQVEKVAAEHRAAMEQLEMMQARPSQSGSPSPSRVAWAQENVKLSNTIAQLNEKLEQKDSAIRDLETNLVLLKTETAVEEGSEEDRNLHHAWDVVTGLLTDTDRQRAGLRTAVAQLELTSVGRIPSKSKAPPQKPLPGATLLKWTEALAMLVALAADEAGDARSYSVSVLRNVIEAHQKAIETAAEKDRAAAALKDLDRQRLIEIERDRDEERRVFMKERERMRHDAVNLKKNMHELLQKSHHNLNATIEMDVQTEQSLGCLAETYTQTGADGGGDGVSVGVGAGGKSVVQTQQATAIQELEKQVESKNHMIRELQDQRQKFLSFVFAPAGKATTQDSYGVPGRSSELAQISVQDFLQQ
eukprot:TRINITY_DN16457_c0_g1_i1.p1 TRINITY_DN16457_c0_g1~~TRINITY_DN16457_c0_g1_i1.p1  ORF type:complete len:535 (+),score=252.32 TRINITY_DN16457_c0_g1_i1:90-1694(+)